VRCPAVAVRPGGAPLAGGSDLRRRRRHEPCSYGSLLVIVPTLRVGTQFATLRVAWALAHARRFAFGELLEKTPSNQVSCSRFGLDFVKVPSLRRRSMGTRQTDIPVLVSLSRHPCRSTHCAAPTLGLHPSRDWRRLGGRVPRSKAKSTATATAGDGVSPVAVRPGGAPLAGGGKPGCYRECYSSRKNRFSSSCWAIASRRPSSMSSLQ